MSTPNAPQPDRPAVILAREDGATIAYHRRTGRGPGVVFLGGFMSDMTGTKARTLDAFCAARGQAYLRFDYFGHGASSGAFADATVGRWKEDALAIRMRIAAGRATLNHREGTQCKLTGSLNAWLTSLRDCHRSSNFQQVLVCAPAPSLDRGARTIIRRPATAQDGTCG